MKTYRPSKETKNNKIDSALSSLPTLAKDFFVFEGNAGSFLFGGRRGGTTLTDSLYSMYTDIITGNPWFSLNTYCIKTFNVINAFNNIKEFYKISNKTKPIKDTKDFKVFNIFKDIEYYIYPYIHITRTL